MLFKQPAFDLAFSSDSSLAAKTVHCPSQEIFATFVKVYFVLRRLIVDGPE